MEFPVSLSTPDEDTRVGRMLSLGDVRVTVTDWETDDHITVRFKAIMDNRVTNGERPMPSESRNWLRAPLKQATHIFLEVPSAGGEYPDKIGTFYPRTGRFFPDKQADPSRVNAAILAAHWLSGNGDDASDDGRYDFKEESYCGKCGKTLTDPISIERGIGPECYGMLTGSHHQEKERVKHIDEMTQQDWDDLQANLPASYSVQRILHLIMDLNEEDQVHILNELQMWHSQGRDSLFGGR